VGSCSFSAAGKFAWFRHDSGDCYCGVRHGLVTFGFGLLNVPGIAMSIFIGVVLIVAVSLLPSQEIGGLAGIVLRSQGRLS
jgi:hypothetical protein